MTNIYLLTQFALILRRMRKVSRQVLDKIKHTFQVQLHFFF